MAWSDTTERDSRAALELERRRLILARSDMKQVEATAEFLLHGHELNAHVERVLWTGMIVTYARPFMSTNRIGAIPGRLARPSPDLQDLHKNVIERRSDLSAHTDVTDLREVVDVFGTGRMSELYYGGNVDALPGLIELARENHARFGERLEEVERLLGSSAGV
jgi:hypothetical protein